jgi:predicted nucleotidyltransferase
MRLSQKEAAIICQSAESVFGNQAQVWLFGSRVDDSSQAGDIDLLIRPAPGYSQKIS